MTTVAGQHEKPGLINGKYILLALLVTVVGCAAFWLVTNAWVRRSLVVTDEPLDYAARAAWPTPPVKHTTMEIPVSNYMPTGPQAKWKTVNLGLSPLERELVDETAALADGAAFTGDATRERLSQITDQYPRLWYPRWLLGQWHALRGDAAEADRHFDEAFRLAPAALLIPYVDPAGDPMAGLPVGTIALACDQADGETIDQSLRLVYPSLTTDDTGRVYLPAYHTILRFADWPQPAGYQAQLGAEYQWFEFPGKLAQLRPSVVWKSQATTDAGR